MAEELVFHDISTGASQDIKQATDIAKKMVCSYGMSERLGLINYAGNEQHLFLGRDITRAEDFSQETAREIDLEIRRIIDEQCERVRQLLSANREKLEKLAEALLEKETMDAHEVYALLEMPERAPTRSAADLAYDFGDAAAEIEQEQKREDREKAEES